MLDKLKKPILINRFNNLLAFNNKLMDRIIKHRKMLEGHGRDLTKIPWCYSDYDECYYRRKNMYECKYKLDYIKACKEIEIGISIMSGVDDRTIMAVRTFLPVNYCKDCDEMVTVQYSFKSENRKPPCTKCASHETRFKIE